MLTLRGDNRKPTRSEFGVRVGRMATRARVKAAAEALLPTRAQCGLLLLEGDLAPALLKALQTLARPDTGV